jgi:DNA-binding MarR family transcriptional regulator
LFRKGLADAAQHTALARRLGVTEKEVLAIQHLATTPGQLSVRLQLSSGGTTGMIHRMQRAGHVKRMSHPRDGRTAVLCLKPEIEAASPSPWPRSSPSSTRSSSGCLSRRPT